MGRCALPVQQPQSLGWPPPPTPAPFTPGGPPRTLLASSSARLEGIFQDQYLK